MQDFYEALGVSRTASQSQIKAAFKKMAMRYHPDHNPGSKEAEETFKFLNEAYRTLSDPVKRSRYDSRFHINVKLGNVIAGSSTLLRGEVPKTVLVLRQRPVETG